MVRRFFYCVVQLQERLIMRRVFASLVVWSVVQSSILNLNAQTVRVMQWNVHGNLGALGGANTPEAKAIARIINYTQPDIVTFCELADNGTINTANELVNWVTNNLTCFGTQRNVTFWVDIAFYGDGTERNGSISRYPISGAFTYSDAGTLGGTNYPNLRGMESFQVQLSGTNLLEVFHVHLKCCSDYPSCPRKQSEAETDATNITAWANSHSFPYVFTGDCNEDETHPECTLTSTYHPITTLLQGGKLTDYAPSTLTPGLGATLTWSTTSASIRLDYVLGATNRIPSSGIVTGIVFRSQDWATHGLYTDASPQNLATDSQTASDHYCVQVTYTFPASATNFNVTPSAPFVSSGSIGGSFSPPSQVYTLTNSDTIPLFWSVTKTSNWLDVNPLATNLTLGAGRSTNITVTLNSVANSLCAGTYSDTLNFSNTATGVSIPNNVTLTVTPSPPMANFTAGPTNGIEPVVVTFTDNSTGFITNRFWDFGDGGTTNVTTNSVVHTYSAGSYTVTLVVTAPCSISSNVQSSCVNVLTAFQSWQLQYFGCTNCPQAQADADPLGKGMSNANQFLAGLNPTNPASVFRVTSIVVQGTNTVITWSTAGGKTNIVQGGVGDLDNNDPAYSNLYYDMSAPIIITGSGDVVTNFLDDGSWWGDFSNWPTHYYRIRLTP